MKGLHLHHYEQGQLAATCGATGLRTARPSQVDCRPCLARLELREKLADARYHLAHEPVALSYGLVATGAYDRRRATELLEQANDAAVRAGIIIRERTEVPA